MLDPMWGNRYISPRDYARKGTWFRRRTNVQLSGRTLVILLLIAAFIGLRMLGISIP
jgi:hypothetical protein